MKRIPVPILNGGLNSLFEYLKGIQGYDSRRRVKMLFVGYAEAGKTTLLNLMHKLELEVTMNGTKCKAEICGSELIFKENNSMLKQLQLNKN